MGPLLQDFVPELRMHLSSPCMAHVLPISCSSIWWPDYALQWLRCHCLK